MLYLKIMSGAKGFFYKITTNHHNTYNRKFRIYKFPFFGFSFFPNTKYFNWTSGSDCYIWNVLKKPTPFLSLLRYLTIVPVSLGFSMQETRVRSTYFQGLLHFSLIFQLKEFLKLFSFLRASAFADNDVFPVRYS